MIFRIETFNSHTSVVFKIDCVDYSLHFILRVPLDNLGRQRDAQTS